MKWKCEVKHRGKRYELVENECGCFGCAFTAKKKCKLPIKKCKLPIGFPTCTIGLLAGRDSFGRHVLDDCLKRNWKEVAQ